MNAKTCLFCVVFLLCCQLLYSSEATSNSSPKTKTIPGGIVAQGKTSKDIIYSALATKETKNLTKNDGAKPDFFAISLNGKTLLWATNADYRRLKVRRLPSAEDQVIQTVYEGRKNSTQLSYMLDDKAECLTISPSGDKFSYERIRTGKSLARVYNMPEGTMYANVPWFAYHDETYHVVYFATIGQNLFAKDESGCGNSAFFPPVCPYRIVGQHCVPHYDGATLIEEDSSIWPVMTSTWIRGTTVVPEDAVKRFSVKQNAYGGTWSKDGKLFATIIQPPNLCYIEINDSTPFFSTGKGYERRLAGVKPGHYYLLLSQEVYASGLCGLAFKPDGSLTCWNKDGKVYLIDHSQIENLISNSGLTANPDRNGYVPIPVNNVATATCTLVAKNIYGTRVCWTSDSAFIFRNQEGALMSWYSGTTEKLLKSVPEIFFYCNTAPAIDESVLIAKKPAAKQEAPQIIGTPNEALDVPKKTRVFHATTEGGSRGKLSVGTIESGWGTDYLEAGEAFAKKKTIMLPNLDIQVEPWYYKGKKNGNLNPKQQSLEFVILDEDNPDHIKDPTVYRYENRTGLEDSGVVIGLNKMIILKSHNDYALIKFIHLEPRYHSRAQVPMFELKMFWLDWDWKKNGPIPIYKSLTCECKFWQDLKAAKPPELAKTAQNK